MTDTQRSMRPRRGWAAFLGAEDSDDVACVVIVRPACAWMEFGDPPAVTVRITIVTPPDEYGVGRFDVSRSR